MLSWIYFELQTRSFDSAVAFCSLQNLNPYFDSTGDALFHCRGFHHSHANLNAFCDHIRDAPSEDIFCGCFCCSLNSVWVQISVEVNILR